MKRTLRMFAILLLSFMVLPMIAQAETPKKENSKAKVVVENGQKKLVLDTGRKAGISFNNASPVDIELLSDAALWKILDSLVAAPWGGVMPFTLRIHVAIMLIFKRRRSTMK